MRVHTLKCQVAEWSQPGAHVTTGPGRATVTRACLDTQLLTAVRAPTGPRDCL